MLSRCGHSLGGAAVLRAAPQIASAKAVVTIGAPFDPGHVTHNFGDALDKITTEGEAEVDLGGRSFTIGRGFVEDVQAQELEPIIASMKKALLVLHAPRDGYGPEAMIAAIRGLATQPRPSEISIPGLLDGLDRVAERAAAAFDSAARPQARRA